MNDFVALGGIGHFDLRAPSGDHDSSSAVANNLAITRKCYKDTMKKLCQPFVVATGTGTKAYEVGEGNSSTSTTLRDIEVANTTAGDLTFTCHIVPSGSSVAASNMWFPAVNIPANKNFQWEGFYEMDSGDYLQAIASGAGLTMHINGEEDKR